MSEDSAHPKGKSQNRPILIGLTGGIASGKSTAAGMFAALDVPVVDADQVARELVLPGQPALTEILQVFGPQAGDETSGLDRRYLREVVFKDDQARERLESILHPAIRAQMFHRALSLLDHYVVLEIPLLVENKLAEYMDRVLVIDCSVDTQIARATQRDNSDPALIRALMATQASRQERLDQAHDVVLNEQDEATLGQCIEQLHQVYLSLSVADAGRYPPIRLP